MDTQAIRGTASSSAVSIGVLCLFLLQPTFIKQFASLFSCIPMGMNAEDIFLTSNLSIRCYTRSHTFLIFFLGLPLFAYVIGTPVSIYILFSDPKNSALISSLLTFHRQVYETSQRQDVALAQVSHPTQSGTVEQEPLNDQAREFEATFGFLFLGYRQETYKWELLVMLRKGLLSTIGIVFANKWATQVIPNN